MSDAPPYNPHPMIHQLAVKLFEYERDVLRSYDDGFNYDDVTPWSKFHYCNMAFIVMRELDPMAARDTGYRVTIR